MGKREHLIKVNIPQNETCYEHGVGEGVFVLVDAETYAAWDKDETGGVWYGTLKNDSISYGEPLLYGAEMVFEMRGGKRPVAVWHGFLDELAKKCDPEAFYRLD